MSSSRAIVRLGCSAVLLLVPIVGFSQQAATDYDLMLTSVSETHRNAVINRQLVREGDMLPDGVMVESIRPHSVLLRRSGEYIEIELDAQRGRSPSGSSPMRVERERPETTEERLHRMQAELVESMSVVQALLDTAAREIARESADEEIMKHLGALQSPGVGEVSENE